MRTSFFLLTSFFLAAAHGLKISASPTAPCRTAPTLLGATAELQRFRGGKARLDQDMIKDGAVVLLVHKLTLMPLLPLCISKIILDAEESRTTGVVWVAGTLLFGTPACAAWALSRMQRFGNLALGKNGK